MNNFPKALFVSVALHIVLVSLFLKEGSINKEASKASSTLSVQLLENKTPSVTELTDLQTRPQDVPAKENTARPNAGKSNGMHPYARMIPKVLEMPDIPLPEESLMISGSILVEVLLDKKGLPIGSTVLEESPQGMFNEWAYAMVMAGKYRPAQNEDGPMESKLKILFQISPDGPPSIRSQ